MAEWFSEENLEQAWRYARIDARDSFAFDVIDYADIRDNLSRVLSSLPAHIREDQYYPAPLLRINVPKTDHSVRPGSVIPIIDLIVLYALAQQLAPLLDPFLSDSAYAYRLNPKRDRSRQPLFKDRSEPESPEAEPDDLRSDENEGVVAPIDFPYNWFINWKLFHDKSKVASTQYEYAAISDITAFFENVSLDLLREKSKEKPSPDSCELIDRLFRLLEFWDWNPSANLPRRIGLPQGNDVSSFLSNLYLIDVDQAMLEIVCGNTSKYYRYVDDITLFTSDRDEARRGLIALEDVLRTLNLNVQPAKTEIQPASEVFDPTIELWLEKKSGDEEKKLDYAREFFETVFEIDKASYWQRPYSRCLTVLRETDDDRAVETALRLFLDNPSYNFLIKNFIYLRSFVATRSYAQDILNRLESEAFVLPYHRAFLYRLAAYSRDDVAALEKSALREATDGESHWLCRVATLFCLGTFSLAGDVLAQIGRLIDSEGNAQVLRAAYVCLCQYSGDELRWVLDKLSLFNAPHQDCLRRYFFRLNRDLNAGRHHLAHVDGVSVRAPTFKHNLHKLDLLKASPHEDQRARFREVLDHQRKECAPHDWPRLSDRLERIYDAFVVR